MKRRKREGQSYRLLETAWQNALERHCERPSVGVTLRTGHVAHFELSTNMTACNGNNVSMMLQHQFPCCTLCLCKSILHVSVDLVNSWVRLGLLVHWNPIAKCPLRLVPARGSENRNGLLIEGF
jgi:hypothetical protein